MTFSDLTMIVPESASASNQGLNPISCIRPEVAMYRSLS